MVTNQHPISPQGDMPHLFSVRQLVSDLEISSHIISYHPISSLLFSSLLFSSLLFSSLLFSSLLFPYLILSDLIIRLQWPYDWWGVKFVKRVTWLPKDVSNIYSQQYVAFSPEGNRLTDCQTYGLICSLHKVKIKGKIKESHFDSQWCFEFTGKFILLIQVSYSTSQVLSHILILLHY